MPGMSGKHRPGGCVYESPFDRHSKFLIVGYARQVLHRARDLWQM